MAGSSDDETLANAPGNNYPVVDNKAMTDNEKHRAATDAALDLNNLQEGKKASE